MLGASKLYMSLVGRRHRIRYMPAHIYECHAMDAYTEYHLKETRYHDVSTNIDRNPFYRDGK